MQKNVVLSIKTLIKVIVNLIFTPLESQNCDDSEYVFCFFFDQSWQS